MVTEVSAVATLVLALVGAMFASIRRILSAHEKLDEVRFDDVTRQIKDGFNANEKLLRAYLKQNNGN